MPKFAADHFFCHSFSNLRYPPFLLPPPFSHIIHGLLSVATGVKYFLNISSSNIENIPSSDQVSARTLPYLTSVTGQLTVESCLNACQASGFPLAGVEYGSQCCWYSNTLNIVSHLSPLSQSAALFSSMEVAQSPADVRCLVPETPANFVGDPLV